MEKMTIIQAALCGVVYWLAVGNLPFVGLWSLQRPLVCGMITGLILGHPDRSNHQLSLPWVYVCRRKYAG